MSIAMLRKQLLVLSLLLVVSMAAGLSVGVTSAQGGPTPLPTTPFRVMRPPYQPDPVRSRATISLTAQGTQQAFPALADAELRQAAPTANFGIAGTFSAGFDLSQSPPDLYRSLLYFDLSTRLPPGTIIHQAQLQLGLAGYCDYDSVSPVTIYRVSQHWSEQRVSWATQPTIAESYGSFAVGTPPALSPTVILGFDLTSLAQRWVAGGEPEYGLMLRGLESPPLPGYDCATRSFFSKGGGGFTDQPILLVDYTLPAPAMRAPAGDQTISRASCDETPLPRTVTVTSNQATLANWSATVSDGADWLSVTPGIGRLSRIFPDRLTLTVSPNAPCTGTHQAQVTIQAPGQAAASFTVTLNNSSSPPLWQVYLPALMKPGSTGLRAQPQASPTPRRYALVIGVADYQYLSPPVTFQLYRAGSWGADLNAPRGDVAAIISVVDDLGSVNLLVYLPEAYATRENIQFAISVYILAQISADQNLNALAEPPAEVLIYFSGHGTQITDLSQPPEPDGFDEIIAPYDANQPAPGSFTNVILDDDLDQWLTALAGHPVGLIFDSCNSGGMEVSDPNHVVLAAAAESQLSWEASTLEHGVFTSFVLSAMANPANDLDSDGWISLAEVYQAVAAPVRTYVQQNIPPALLNGQNQDPQLIRTIGHDVRLTKLP
jgi:hypothetical protein